MNRHPRSLRIAVCTAVMLSISVAAHGSPGSRQRTREAFAHAYRMDFAAAYLAFAEAAALDATDPAPPRGVAAVAWIETLFGQGVATFEAFTGQVSKTDVVRPPVPPALAQKFRTHLDRALSLAQQRVKTSNDADAHYELGATEALSALYMATVEGRTLGSLGAGRRAVRALERSRALNPARREPALVLGMSRYTVSTMSAPVRLLARMAGLSGGRAEGISLLEEAASPDADTEIDALLILMIVDNREERHTEATERLSRLRSRYPTNRLLTLNEGVTALEAGQFQRAERVLAEGLEVHDVRAAPPVLGEEALWRLKLGTARAALKRSDEAQRDLSAALALPSREWVQARAHAELGKLARSRGDEADAQRRFARALDLAQRSGDGSTVRQVQSLLRVSPRNKSVGVRADSRRRVGRTPDRRCVCGPLTRVIGRFCFNGVESMVASPQSIACVLVFCVALTSGGCTSMKTVRPVTQPGMGAIFGTIKAGDLVDLRTVDGRTARFIVQQVAEDAIIAPDGVRYTHAEIVELRKRSFSGPKRAGLIAAICGGLFVLAAIAVASAVNSLWG